MTKSECWKEKAAAPGGLTREDRMVIALVRKWFPERPLSAASMLEEYRQFLAISRDSEDAELAKVKV